MSVAMRISLLLQREPFGHILEKTLAAFLHARTGAPHTVSWYGRRTDLKTLRLHDRQAWLGNIYLNAIFVPEVAPSVLAPVYREFSHSETWWKRPAQRAYCALSVQPWTASWFAQAGMIISPSVTNAEHLLIVGGNHKIRIFDESAGKAYGILKAGSSPCFFQQEVLMRRQAAACGVPVLPLTEFAADGTWFSEPLLHATPANRLQDKRLAREATMAILDALRILLEKTGREENVTDYADGLVERARRLTTTSVVLGAEQQRAVLRLIEGLAGWIHTLQAHASNRLLLAITHGDLQPGNILVDSSGAGWLIDWEYAACRQAGHDVIAHSLRPRFPERLAERLAVAWQAGSLLESFAVADWPGLPWSDAPARRLHLMLFLLEELVVQLQENANPLFFRPGRGLLLLLGEVARFLARQ
jgi:hypothetical protein